MSSDRLKGFAVVSVTEGLTLGHVAAALFDPTTLALRAFRVTGDGQAFLLPLDGVATIGPDAIMVENSLVTRPITVAGDYADLVELDALKDRRVVDAAGTLLGTLSDLAVDLTTGTPLRLTAHKGGFLGRGGETMTIAGAAVRSVGGDLITVDATTASDEPEVAATGTAANVAAH